MDAPKKKFKVSYHWVIFIIGFLMVFTSLGFGSNTRHAYKSAITDDLTSGLNNIFLYGFTDTFRYVSTAVLNIFFGLLVKKFGARRMVLAGFAALTASSAIASFATQYWHLYVSATLLGIGFAWTTTTIVGYIVERWFTNGKGTIMGIILAASGLGGAVSEVIINPMCNEAGNLGWRFAYRLTVVIFIAFGTIAYILLRDTPAEKGLEPLGKNSVAKKKRGADWVGFDMKDVWNKPYFYVCAVCIFFTGMILQSMNGLSKVHIYSVVGKSDDMVAWVTGVFVVHSLVLLISKILAGVVFDRFGINFAFAYCSVFAIVSLMSLALMTDQTTWAQNSAFSWIYSVCSSIALPLETIMIPLLVSEIFGRKCHAKIMGYYLGVNIFGYACGGPIADYFKQNAGSYNNILIVFCVIMAVTATTIQVAFVVAKKDRVAFEQSLELTQKENA